MATPTYRVFDPLLPQAQADDMLRLCERFGTYGMYSQEGSVRSDAWQRLPGGNKPPPAFAPL